MDRRWLSPCCMLGRQVVVDLFGGRDCIPDVGRCAPAAPGGKLLLISDDRRCATPFRFQMAQIHRNRVRKLHVPSSAMRRVGWRLAVRCISSVSQVYRRFAMDICRDYPGVAPTVADNDNLPRGDGRSHTGPPQPWTTATGPDDCAPAGMYGDGGRRPATIPRWARPAWGVGPNRERRRTILRVKVLVAPPLHCHHRPQARPQQKVAAGVFDTPAAGWAHSPEGDAL